MHKHYLVRINGHWTDVRGCERLVAPSNDPRDGMVHCLEWEDPRGGRQSFGTALEGDFIRHYPRYWSPRERVAMARAERYYGRRPEESYAWRPRPEVAHG